MLSTFKTFLLLLSWLGCYIFISFSKKDFNGIPLSTSNNRHHHHHRHILNQVFRFGLTAMAMAMGTVEWEGDDGDTDERILVNGISSVGHWSSERLVHFIFCWIFQFTEITQKLFPILFHQRKEKALEFGVFLIDEMKGLSLKRD